MYPYDMYMQQTAPQSMGPGINWVQGLEGAKAAFVPRNGAALFMDSENEGIFYIKTSDNIGISNIRTFKYEEVTKTQEAKQKSEYVTRKELDEIIASLRKEASDE